MVAYLAELRGAPDKVELTRSLIRNLDKVLSGALVVGRSVPTDPYRIGVSVGARRLLVRRSLETGHPVSDILESIILTKLEEVSSGSQGR